MRVLLLLIAAVVLMMGCAPKNPVAPPPTAAELQSSKADPNQVPSREPTYVGEPYRGTDPDLGPTG